MAVNKVMYDNDTLIDTSNDTALEEYVMEGFTFHSYSGEKLTGNLNVYNMVANAYDATQTYAIGDYVIYEKYLYQCSTAISSPEAWNSAHWTQVTVGEELEQANQGIANTYTKSQVDTALGNYYTKTQMDTTMANYYNKTQIDSKVTQINNNTATAYSSSSQYSVGDYCLYNGALYRCTTAIPSGEAWTAGHWTSVDIADDMRRVFDVTNDNVAELYDSTKTYALGEFCIYQDNLYRCTTAITTAEAFNALHWTQTNVGDEIVDINTALETKAEIDGYYESMTVGNAEQLVATVGVEEEDLYMFRTTGGSADVGDRVDLKKLTGGTVAWNQLIPTANRDFTSDKTDTRGYIYFLFRLNVSPYTTFSSNNISSTGKLVRLVKPSVTGNAHIIHSGSQRNLVFADGLSVIKDHIYVLSIEFTGVDLTTVGGVTTKDLMLLDLTQMLGATIADYIYGLETNQAGDGVAFFRKYFPKTYYAYDAGSLQSVCTSAHTEVGFNQWDEVAESGYYDVTDGSPASNANLYRSKNAIPVVPNTTYYIKNSTHAILANVSIRLLFYDANNGFISSPIGNSNSRTFTTPDNCYYLRFFVNEAIANYDNTICINLHWDGERDGEYEPFDSNSYPIDDIQLRGIPKLDADNNLYYDGDTYTPDGTVTRKYGVYTFDGTESWERTSYTLNGVTQYYFRLYSTNYTSKIPNAYGGGLFTLSKPYDRRFARTYWYSGAFISDDIAWSVGTTGTAPGICIRDDTYTDATTFKAAMSGMVYVYELATPTTESADPYQLTQVCNDFGTEYFTDAGVAASTRDVEIPVFAEAYYQANLRAKLEMAPNSPDGAGDYIVRQTDGMNEYVPVDSNQTIINIQNRVPVAPVEDDSYMLQSDVRDGNATYEWKSTDNITVGNAKQLESTVGITDEVPYNFRTSGGSIDIGDRETDMVVGGTMAWNQMIGYYFATAATKSTSDGIVTVTPSGSTNRLIGTANSNSAQTKLPKGHKGYVAVIIKSDGEHSVGFQNYLCSGLKKTTSSSFVLIEDIVESESNSSLVQLFSQSQTVYQIKDGSFICVDLTQMFGSTIADYISTLESGIEGAGVAWLKSHGFFTKPFYAYNSGTLESVQTSEHKMVGFNQLSDGFVVGKYWSNGVYGNGNANNAAVPVKIRCIPSTTYCISLPNESKANNIYVIEFDASGNYLRISSFYTVSSTVKYKTFQTSADAYFFSFNDFQSTGVLASDLEDACVSLHWDGERDGEYQPFEQYSYPLDSSLELRGIPKLDASNNLYYDGDTYESNGTVTRRYGSVDLGTLEWNYNTSFSVPVFYAPLSVKVNNRVNTGICSKYLISTDNATGVQSAATILTNVDKMMVLSNGSTNPSIYIRDSAYSDKDTFATAMSGVYLVYELATPTTESADPYQNPQIVDDWGTEEYIDAAVTAETPTRDVAIPVGHNTFYSSNLKSKLEMAPDSPSNGDNDYIVRQTSGENEYVLLSSNPTISGLQTRVPACATGTDGTYVLKATVSGSTVTYAWEAQA